MNARYSILDTRSSIRVRATVRLAHNPGRGQRTNIEKRATRGGFVLALVLVALVILSTLAVGAMMASYGSRIQATRIKAETEAMLAAEAGYERAIFWMSQQTDILGALGGGSGSGAINFGTSRCTYEVTFADYLGARPVFKVAATGISGRPTFTRVVEVDVMQETSGWAMGACRVPSGTSSTTAVYFKGGEIIDMPLHINNRQDNPDNRDIWITGSPRFLHRVEMGEPRKTSGGTDKYSSVISYFEGGIYFDQPNVRITDEAAVQSKIDRFRDSTDATYRFTPVADTNVTTRRYPAVQLEFYVDTCDVGKVRISNNCTVQGAAAGTYDYMVVPGSGGNTFQKYDIYDYHFEPNVGNSYRDVNVRSIESTYVTQRFGSYESEPGGQIYINGNVVIGGSDAGMDPNMVVKGKITVVATGHIWIADSINVDGPHDANGMPTADNPNVLGLIAQGVVRIVNPTSSNSPSNPKPTRLVYKPIGISGSGSGRYLPDRTIVEAAISVGGGGFGAEEVSSPGRREYSGSSDDLYVRGSITEVIRGVVNIGDPVSDGYVKNYHIDTRLMTGILPADIWFSGKYIPAPAGWHDFRP